MNILSVTFGLCVLLSGIFDITDVHIITILAGLWILVYNSE